MDNRERITEALEAGGPATYAELEARSGVAPGSFGRVVGRMVEAGAIAKSDSNYHLPEQVSDVANATEVPPAFNPDTYRGSWAYCAACGGAHPKPREHDNAHGMTYQRAHAEGIVA